MDQVTIHKIVSEIVKKRSTPDKALSDSARLREFGIDSMALMDVVLDIEDQFSIQIPEDLLTPENLNTVSGLVNLVTKLKK